MREDFIRVPTQNRRPGFPELTLAGMSYCDGSYRIARRNSSLYVFEYVLEGEGYLIENGRRFYPKAGDVYLVHRGSDHEYGSDAKNPWTKAWFNVRGELIDRLVDLYDLRATCHVPNLDVKKTFMDELETLRRDPEEGLRRLPLALHEILNAVAVRVGENAAPPKPKETAPLREYLDRHYRENVSLAQMAAVLNKSPSSALRRFKEDWGVTPYRYLLDLKMETARTLLRETTARVKEIAFDLGFTDEFYFSNLFRKKHGISPAGYRMSTNGD